MFLLGIVEYAIISAEEKGGLTQMVPYELKEDKKGRLYTDDLAVLTHRLDEVDKRAKVGREKSKFYSFDNGGYYIIKNPPELTLESKINYMQMLTFLLEAQEKVHLTELPIGYYRKCWSFTGLIIRYYGDGTLSSIINEKNIEAIKKYYHHSDDSIENLFLLLEDYLKSLEELYRNGIYYYDFNSGNIIIYDNSVKIIDFDPDQIAFNWTINARAAKMKNLMVLLGQILGTYNLLNAETYSSFALESMVVEELSEVQAFLKSIKEDIISPSKARKEAFVL